jgi:selenocysteine-specific elongation factor
VQIELEEPVIAAVHDRFVIRQYSPVTTVGGGEVVEVGGLRHRRFRVEVLDRLERKLSGSPFARLGEELQMVRGPVTPGDLSVKAGLSIDEVQRFLEEMRDTGDVFLHHLGSETHVVSAALMTAWEQAVDAALQQYHQQFPLRSGYPKEELRSRIFSAIPPRLYQALLDKWTADRKVALTGQTLARPDFSIHLTPGQQEICAGVVAALRAQPFAPPAIEELRLLFGDPELFQYYLQQESLVKVGEEFYFLQEAVDQAWQLLQEYLIRNGTVTVAEARDMLGTSRRYCLPLLEFFDQSRMTRRLGDKREFYRQK